VSDVITDSRGVFYCVLLLLLLLRLLACGFPCSIFCPLDIKPLFICACGQLESSCPRLPVILNSQGVVCCWMFTGCRRELGCS
jgi:hypothetical protein